MADRKQKLREEADLRYRNTFDTPGELSAQLACSPYDAHEDEDVPSANIEPMDLPYVLFCIP